jgi:hypothetical protein
MAISGQSATAKPTEMFTIRRHQSTQMTVNGTYFSRFADQEKLEK